MDERTALDKTFADCLIELKTRAIADIELLSEKVVECTNEMAGIGTTTITASNENDTEASTEKADDDRQNHIEISGRQSNSSTTS